MAAQGFAGTSVSTLVSETGISRSAIYHHFQSKAGVLAAVMEQSAEEFFAGMKEAHQNPPDGEDPRGLLHWYLRNTGEIFHDHQDFLRLQILLVSAEETLSETADMVVRIRDTGRDYMRTMIKSAFMSAGEDQAELVAGKLAHLSMACFDGAFISLQSGDGKPISEYMEEIADALDYLGNRILHSLP